MPDDPFVPPATSAPLVEPSGAPASRLKRLLAAMLDTIIGLGMASPVFLYRLAHGQPWNHQPESIGEHVVLFAYSVAAFLLAHGYLLHRYGQTIGKRIVGIRIATVYYTTPSLFWSVGVRTLPVWLVSYFPWGLPIVAVDVLLIFTPMRRCGHDYLAQTIVVDAAKRYQPVEPVDEVTLMKPLK